MSCSLCRFLAKCHARGKDLLILCSEATHFNTTNIVVFEYTSYQNIPKHYQHFLGKFEYTGYPKTLPTFSGVFEYTGFPKTLPTFSEEF